MRNSKGISMISLVVTIIVTILLAGFAIVIGSRYLKESRKKNTEVFVSVLSNAVSKRHEDTNVDSSKFQYLGYYVNDSSVFNNVFAPKISSPVSFDDGIWYVVDTKTAAGLGVAESKEYIGTIDDSGNADGKVALVNYADGSVYIVDIGTTDLSGLSLFESDYTGGVHAHRYLDGYPTCTLPKKCVDCGFIKEEALGHTYVNSSPTATVGDEENSHYTKVCSRCGMPGGYETHTAIYTYTGSWTHRTRCTVCGYQSPANVACSVIYSRPEDYTKRPLLHVKSCSVCGHSEEEAHSFAFRRISYAEHEKYCTVCDYTVLSEHHVDENNDNKCDLCGAELVSYPLFRIVTMVNSSATDESGRHVAKYGDTIELTLSTDKEIKNLVIYIAGQRVPNGNMTTADNRNWKITLTLTSAMNIPDGNLSLKINCESMSGVAIPVAITTVTDGQFVAFDGTPPILQYIKKIIRAKE